MPLRRTEHSSTYQEDVEAELSRHRHWMQRSRHDIFRASDGRCAALRMRQPSARLYWKAVAAPRGYGQRVSVDLMLNRAWFVPVSDRGTFGGLTQFATQFGFWAEPLARKPLILKIRRDVRVVEGARLEIALAVCDGVLRISITVAKPTT